MLDIVPKPVKINKKINYQMSTLKMSGGGNASSWLKSA